MKGLVVALLMVAGASCAYGETAVKQEPKTLLALSGFRLEASRLSNSVLLIIDAQREYVDGKLPLDGVDASVKEVAALLDRARKAGTPVIHVVHTGKPGSALFDPKGPYVDIVGALAPKGAEPAIKKGLPNAFAGTGLEETLAKLGRKNLIVVGLQSAALAALADRFAAVVQSAADIPD